MDYVIDVLDPSGLRVGRFREPPLLDVTRTGPDEADVIRGLAPVDLPSLAPGYRVRVMVEDGLFCEGTVTWTGPAWGDSKKLVLDRYLSFHELLAFEARSETRAGNTSVSQSYLNRRVSDIVLDVINHAPGPVHYTVQHTAYPEGAQREYAKFLARRDTAEALAIGGISSGQWVGADRIDTSAAYAKDGDTIAGLKVDGEDWPDLRLMMIDAEETSLNSQAVARHPELVDWEEARYAASPYALRGEAARAFLQTLIEEDGIDYIELNPHRDGTGAFDGRVDGYGRYLGLVYGGGRCFNAALVEQDLADVQLHADGRYLDPALALKEFYSYAGAHGDSVDRTEATLNAFEAQGGALEALTALAYAAGGWVFRVEPDWSVRFRNADTVDAAVYYDPEQMSVQYGGETARLVNVLSLSGHPLFHPEERAYQRENSVAAYGKTGHALGCFAFTDGQDLDQFAAALMDDLAYPAVTGSITFFHGNGAVRVGDLLELRGGPLREWGERLEDAWGGRYADRLVGRVRSVTHRFAGRYLETAVSLASPLRSVDDPAAFMVRQQPSPEQFFAFRVDDGMVGLDLSYHLD